MKNKVGHTSSTFLKSCSFQRYRLLSPIKFLLIVDFKVYGLSEGASQAFDMLVDNEGNYVMGGHTTVGDGVVNWDCQLVSWCSPHCQQLALQTHHR